MATVNKDFRIKQGLVIEGASGLVVNSTLGTLNSSQILTEANFDGLATEKIQDIVGAMVDSNTESNISVTYNDDGGKLNFDIQDYTISLGGDLSGTLTIYNGTNGGTLTASVAANSVALGTDTTGDYVGSLVAGTGITVSTTAGEGAAVTVTNSDRGSSQNIFKNVVVGAVTIVADSNDDTLTFTAGAGVTLTGNATNDSVEITNSGVTSLTGTANEIEVSSTTGSITVGLPNNVTIGGTLTVTGDLLVSGTTTTLNTSELLVEDNLILLNSGVTGTPTLDAGLEVERGTYTNAQIYWNETENAWHLKSPGDDTNPATDAEIATVGAATFNNFNTFTDGTNLAQPDTSTDTFTFTAGTGITAVINGTTDALTITNVGVTSVTGTSDQVLITASTGAVTFSLPQSIATTSSVTFANVTASTTVTAQSVVLAEAALSSKSTVVTGTTATVVDSWSTNTYSTAKYLVQMKSGNDIEAIEILVAVDGTNNVYITEYADVYSNAVVGVTNAIYNSPNVELTVALEPAYSAGTTVKVSRTLMEA
jgi:hypothetical protein